METENIFKNNYHGILDHEGCIKVAGYDKEQTIKYIVKNKRGKCTEVFVQGIGKKYKCQIHKDLMPSMIYCKVEDTAFVKFKNNTAWIVGFKKSKKRYIDDNITINGDADLLNYFQQQKKLSNQYDKE